MYCKNCGHELNGHMKFCPGCGAVLKKVGEAAPAGRSAEESS
ncbi:MAG: zinc-ribbon domain-containing protein, partial [bacterium]